MQYRQVIHIPFKPRLLLAAVNPGTNSLNPFHFNVKYDSVQLISYDILVADDDAGARWMMNYTV